MRVLTFILALVTLLIGTSGCMMDPDSIDPPDGVLDAIIEEDKDTGDKDKSGSKEDEDDTSEMNDDKVGNQIFKGTEADKAIKMLSMQEGIQSENLMISPVSINTALGMASNILNDEALRIYEEYTGKSLDSINSEAKDIISSVSEEDEASIANSVWVNGDILDIRDIGARVREALDTYYSAEFNAISNLDVKPINTWVSDKTNGMIKSIANELNDDFRLMIVNALYFKDTWEDEFIKSNTVTETFTKSDGSTVDVDMMQGYGDTYMRNTEYEGFSKLYSSGKRFIGIKPINGGKLNIEDINLETLLETSTTKYDVSVKMPKLKFEYSTSLKDTLSNMGLDSIFSEAIASDVVQNAEKNIRISDVIHKTAIELNEEGTEASAVTAVIADTAAIMPDEPEIKEVILNRPYLFMIMDRDNNIWFMGVVNNP